MLAMAAALALAGVAQGAAGTTTETTSYTVGSGGVPGISTGLVLSGGSVTVVGAGIVCPGTGFCYGPDGDPAANTLQSTVGGFVLPGAPGFGLVGRVGDGPWVQVGSGPTTLTGTGELVFAVNDDLFWDNVGTFTATVTVTVASAGASECKPGWGYGDANHDHCGPPGLVGKQGASQSDGQTGTGNGTAQGRS
jgi:hypothetical protein